MGLLENTLADLTYTKAALILCSVYILWSFASWFAEDHRIRSLGHRAPIRVSYVPWGLDMLYDGVNSALKHQAMGFWVRLFEKYGNPKNPYTVEAGTGSRRIILTADPENIKAILATQFQDFGKGEMFNKDWHDFLGDSIFTTDGQKWHDSRQLIRPQFIKDRLSDIDIFEKHVQVLLPLLGGNGETVDVADLFFRYTLDAATDFLLGRSVESLVQPDTRFVESFNAAQHIQSIIARLGPFNWLLPRGRFHGELKVINDYVNPFIEQALRLNPKELELKTKDEGYTFLHAIAAHTRDRTVIRDQLVAVLLAGRDTTACTLQWTFYELSRKPHILQKLRGEILEQVGPTNKPTYADLKAMKYLQVGGQHIDYRLKYSNIYSIR
jgi:cytochrome P450